MKSKNLFYTIALVFINSLAFGQVSIESYVKEGIQFHDKGEFDQAIEKYQKALAIDPKSALVNFEISFSYMAKGDYSKALKYSDIVLKLKGDYMLEAYINKGSCLDNMGEPKKAIKAFKKGIKKTNGHYLLYFNMALTYLKMGNTDDAQANAIKAIELSPSHGTSHLILATISRDLRNTAEAILSAHYFLMLEPTTSRSQVGYDILMENFQSNTSNEKGKPTTINISFNPESNSEFKGAGLMIGLLQASGSLEENEGKSQEEMFVKNTKSIFTYLGQLNEDKEGKPASGGIFIPTFSTN